WDDDIDDPVGVLAQLKQAGPRIDLVTFMQRLPDSRPRFTYAFEWDNVAALPIRSYDHWLNHQLHSNHRNKIKKAQKEGVVVRRVPFDDEFVAALLPILNESQTRQGTAFTDYGKDLETVRREHATYLERSDFLGAYHKDELIGYIKLVYTGRYMRTMQILAM